MDFSYGECGLLLYVLQVLSTWDDFDKLCEVQCTAKEISACFGFSEDTLERACKRELGKTFAEAFDQKRQKGHTSLRHKQYELAVAGDKTMLIWLGKQWLGQTERSTVHQTNVNQGETIKIYIPDNGRDKGKK